MNIQPTNGGRATVFACLQGDGGLVGSAHCALDRNEGRRMAVLAGPAGHGLVAEAEVELG